MIWFPRVPASPRPVSPCLRVSASPRPTSPASPPLRVPLRVSASPRPTSQMCYIAPMSTITLNQTSALIEDRDGTIRLAGSRVPLDTVVYEFNQGATAEQIQDSFPSLSLRSIYGAIAFYLEHQEAVDHYLRQRAQEAAELKATIECQPEIAAFRKRLRHRRAQLVPS